MFGRIIPAPTALNEPDAPYLAAEDVEPLVFVTLSTVFETLESFKFN